MRSSTVSMRSRKPLMRSPRGAVRGACEGQQDRNQNLKDAFAGESQANRRYLYFAAKADVEGYNDVAALFRSTAEGETGHAHGHLEYLEAVSATRPPACRSASSDDTT
jgi:rubrerythrin